MARAFGALASVSCFAAAGLVLACSPTQTTPPEHADTRPPPIADAGPDLGSDAALEAAAREILDAAASPDAAVTLGPEYTDPMANHKETTEGLLSLFSIRSFTPEEESRIHANLFLQRMFQPTGPAHANQGNKAIAEHLISKQKCLEGLKGYVIQTAEQKAKCGAENMVPVWVKGKEAWYCIDVFEFPNKACELPMVWTQPPLAKKVCELQGKRLCSDIEWNIACRGDPEGGDDWKYAYGNKLDLDICHTNKRHRGPCIVQDAYTTWKSCQTDTEPSGSYPKCHSRFGVFDQHGNVAEVMMRREADNKIVTQLKGSAWFYNELAKEPGEPVPETTTNKNGAYPDHCNFDPRWHVEPLETAGHVNYHLGFRCCKSIP